MLDSVICVVKWAVHAIGQTILTVIDFILSVLIGAVNLLVALLPNDPTGPGDGIDSQAIEVFNYFVPMGAIMGEFTLIMTAWILYRLYEWLLRWAKADEAA